jgi:hypothetical protein
LLKIPRVTLFLIGKVIERHLVQLELRMREEKPHGGGSMGAES